jgi:Uma2 family endonuclease
VLDLSDVIRLSEEDLLRICAANPDLQIEQNAAGQLEIMSPAGPSSSAGAAKLILELGRWKLAVDVRPNR